MPKIYLYDHATGQEVEREMNEEEAAAREIHVNEWLNAKEAKAEEERTKATAKADLLAKLGITEEEAKLLLS